MEIPVIDRPAQNLSLGSIAQVVTDRLPQKGQCLQQIAVAGTLGQRLGTGLLAQFVPQIVRGDG